MSSILIKQSCPLNKQLNWLPDLSNNPRCQAPEYEVWSLMFLAFAGQVQLTHDRGAYKSRRQVE